MHFIYAPIAHIYSHSDEKPDRCIENSHFLYNHFCVLYCKITIDTKQKYVDIWGGKFYLHRTIIIV